MKNIFPKKLKLQKGDCIGLLACAGATGSPEQIVRLENAKEYFEALGFKVKISKTALAPDCDYLCDTDASRAEAVNEFFADNSIDAIINVRGGYGSIRILDKIDYNIIKNNPKIFAGYSDITALSLMIYKKSGLVTFNAPMAIPDFGNGIDEFSENSFKNFFINEGFVGKLSLHNPVIYKSGTANGILWGGNLATIQSLCGLDFVPEEKIIFVVEDINEPVYKIDKMLTQLLNIANFKENLAGVVLGDFSDVDDVFVLQKYFKKLAEELTVPVISGLKFGHEKEKETFPIGVNCRLDTAKGEIQFNLS